MNTRETDVIGGYLEGSKDTYCDGNFLAYMRMTLVKTPSKGAYRDAG